MSKIVVLKTELLIANILTFRHGLGVSSNAALKSCLCWDVNIVLGRLQEFIFLSSYSCGLVVDILSLSSLLKTSTKK